MALQKNKIKDSTGRMGLKIVTSNHNTIKGEESQSFSKKEINLSSNLTTSKDLISDLKKEHPKIKFIFKADDIPDVN